MPHIDFCYEFQTFCLDVAQRVLTRNGQAIPLTPKATEVLLILVQRAGQIVEKDVIINEVWPDSFVEEANLTQNIFLLRRALEDDGNNAKFIETVARRGYRFVAPVQRVEIPAPSVDDAGASLARISVQPILAVMPFANGTGNPELQYLAEGIPETIINCLSGLSQLRVISRSAAFRYRNREIDPQLAGRKLGAEVLLVGKISGRESTLSVAVELVNAATGWQLWGQTFKVETENIFDIQDQITTQISRALHLPLTREDEKRVAKRYTENAGAYQAYLEGRFHWSRYTRVGIEKAIGHFGRAIDQDPNYALAYASIVDCYLRLATNYLPPEDDELASEEDGDFELDAEMMQHAASATQSDGENFRVVAQEKVKLRHEWDWKGAERELRRANELKTDYPAAHQWHAAYRFSWQLAEELSPTKIRGAVPLKPFIKGDLPPTEEIQVLCAAAREQMEAGNYEGGCLVLRDWWVLGDWPKLDGLTTYAAADFLFTVGTLAHCMASTGQLTRGHKHSEALLNGALALCELLALNTRASEVRAELGACYYRQGFFDLAHTTLEHALIPLSVTTRDLIGLCLFRLAVVDRHAGRLHNSMSRLKETEQFAQDAGPWILGRYHQEFGTTLRDLAVSEGRGDYFEDALLSFRKALYEFEAVGNHRYVGAVHNNIGFVLSAMGRFKEAEKHLFKARKFFLSFGDEVRCSQVDESLAQLYLTQGRLELAEEMIGRAVLVLEKADEEALLAEALITRGRVLLALTRDSEAKAALDGAYRIAERCRHNEGAGLALLILLEELPHHLLPEEKQSFQTKVKGLLEESQQAFIRDRLKHCLDARA